MASEHIAVKKYLSRHVQTMCCRHFHSLKKEKREMPSSEPYIGFYAKEAALQNIASGKCKPIPTRPVSTEI